MPAATIACLFFALPVSAAWMQKDLGTIQSLRGIAQSGDALIAAGNTGTILRSSDAGETWSVIDKNASVFWQDVEADGQTVRVVGEGGTMRESTDAGQTWSNVALNITNNLYAIETLGNYGWVVGVDGRVMSLNPTAHVWQSVTAPTTRSLQDVQIVNASTAWMVGNGGVLLHTSDYGTNWTNKGDVAQEDLFGVWFVSPTVGYVVGKNGTFRKTTDAGASWMNVSVDGLMNQSLYDIQVSGDRMTVVGDKLILTSDDGGTNWTSISYATENFTFKSSTFDASGNIWVAGTQDDVKSVILKFETEVTEPAPDAGLENPDNGQDTTGAEEPLVEASTNSLIKLACSTQVLVNDPCQAVYFYGTDGKRHAFPNEKVFFTWFENFDTVVTVSQSFMSTISLGKNVTYHPGTRMVKFQSVPTVYAVSAGGVLRAIASEEVASQLYGTDWNQQIDDISDAFIGNYSFGEKILVSGDYDVSEAKTSVTGLNQQF